MYLNIGNVRALCHSIDLTVPTPLVDLYDVTFMEPFSLVYLGTFLRYHNFQGKKLSVRLPADQAVREYLARQQFWSRFNFKPEDIKSEDLRRITTSTSLNDIVDIERKTGIAEEIADGVTTIIRNSNIAVDAYRIGELVSEIVDNFAQHSGDILGVFAAQYYPQGHRLEVSLGDCGVGIRESLAGNPEYEYLAEGSHADAAMKAFEPLVSRRSEGGTGLTEVREGTIELGGRLYLSTGDGYVQIIGSSFNYGTSAYDFPGVQIGLSFPER